MAIMNLHCFSFTSQSKLLQEGDYIVFKQIFFRACVRYDTMCILGVSLNLKDRVHAIVWNFTGLPMTVNRCLPLLQPIGGVRRIFPKNKMLTIF